MPSEALTDDHERQILDCWQQNADPWVDAIRNQEIASRVLVTNHAIESAVAATQPRNVIDVGCGEGWLVRRLQERGIAARGLDVVPALIDSAARYADGSANVRFAAAARTPRTTHASSPACGSTRAQRSRNAG